MGFGALAAIFLLGFYLVAVAGSALMLSAPEGAPRGGADALVVLGGDGPARAAKAAELWELGLARHVIVAGDGDCRHIRSAMIRSGVPREVIAIECRSGNTWMNAVESAGLLEASRTRSAILVTSWFHTGRATRVFERICPGIRWFSIPTEPPSIFEAAFGPYGPAIAKEYVKVAAYRLREWLLAADRPRPGDACVHAGSIP
jgi:uncharacterized SAM-binding protein YcdF (DUF218 family)